MSQESQAAMYPAWKRLLFSDNLISKSKAHKVAYVGVSVALCIVTNFFELKFADVQFSFTILSSILAGIFLGPLLGFCGAFLGDFIGYLGNSMGYPYYWWVALGCACMALLAGLLTKLPLKLYTKMAFICISTLLICSVGINTTGMYFIGLKLYMSDSVREAFVSHFGGVQTYFGYLLIRFFVLGQIYNSLLNYALLFLIILGLKAVKPLRFETD